MNLEELLSLEYEKLEEFLRTLSSKELDTLQGEVKKKAEVIKEELKPFLEGYHSKANRND